MCFILIVNPKYSTVPATRKKINLIPAKTSTLQDAFWLVSKHYSSTSLLLPLAVNSAAQLVTSDVLADLVYFEKLLKCSSKDTNKARGREYFFRDYFNEPMYYFYSSLCCGMIIRAIGWNSARRCQGEGARLSHSLSLIHI